MITLKICATIHKHKLNEFHQAMESITIQMSDRGGNAIYRLLNNERSICIIEDWDSISLVDSYLKSDVFKYILGALTVLGDITEAKIITTSNVDNIEERLLDS